MDDNKMDDNKMDDNKIIDFGEFTVTVVKRYKDAEIDIFDKGKKIIDSCVSLDQIKATEKYIDLVSSKFKEVGSALKYFCESKTREIVWHDALTKVLEDNEARDAIVYDATSKEIDAQAEVDFQTDVDFQEVNKCSL